MSAVRIGGEGGERERRDRRDKVRERMAQTMRGPKDYCRRLVIAGL